MYSRGPSRKFARRANSGPAFKSGKAAGITVCHREYIQDVTTGKVVGGASVFDTQVFALQVGVASTFPWLASLATNFEQYNLKRVRFEFISTCADGTAAGTNNSLGSVMGAVEYNVYGAVPNTKQQLENMYMSRSGKPSTSQSFYVDCKRSHSVLKDLYIRGGVAPPAGQDQRMYDFGYFVLATQGMQSQNVVGELWVSYEVEMMKPQMVGLGASGLAQMTQLGWSYQLNKAAPLYSGPLWWDDFTLANAAGATTSRVCGIDIRSPPGSVGGTVYPNTTIACAPQSSSPGMLVGVPTISPPNNSFNTILDSQSAVTPWVPASGVSQSLSWLDQSGILFECSPPFNVAGTLTPPVANASGGFCIYFPPTLAGPFRLTFNMVLTNSVQTLASQPARLACSSGVRGLNMYTQYNNGTDAVTAVPIANVNSSWFTADTDNNAIGTVYCTLIAAVQLSPANGAYEWFTVSGVGSNSGYTVLSDSYSQWNMSIEALPESTTNTYTLV